MNEMYCFAGIVELEEETPLVQTDAFEGVSLSDLSLGKCNNLFLISASPVFHKLTRHSK